MRTGMVLGILGSLAGLTAAAFGFVIYMVNGTNGVANPYASRVGWDLAAFALALVAGVGAGMLLARPRVGSLLLMVGSVLGCVAISLFYINTWYVAAVPLCLIGAVLALGKAEPAAFTVALRGLALILLGAGVVLGWVLGGIAVAAGFAVAFALAGVLLLGRPRWIP